MGQVNSDSANSAVLKGTKQRRVSIEAVSSTCTDYIKGT